MNPFYLSIPKPCHEDWDKMNPTECGAFCNKCSKEVIDLTNFDIHDIQEKLISKSNPCVKIGNEQIRQHNFLQWFNHLSLRNQLKYVFLFSFTIIFEFGLLSNTEKHEIELDTIDITTTEELLNEYQDIIPEEEYIEPFKFIWDFPILETAWMGNIITTGTVIYPIIELWEDPFEGSYFQYNSLSEQNANSVFNPIFPKSNIIIINNSSYQFKIINDMIQLEIISNDDLDIDLTASLIAVKNTPFNTNRKVFTESFKVDTGTKALSFPIENLVNGLYRINIKIEEKYYSTEMMYW